jgi:hypothetical protein
MVSRVRRTTQRGRGYLDDPFRNGSLAAATSLLLLASLFLLTPVLLLGQDTGTGINLKIVGNLDLSPPLPEEGQDIELGVLVQNNGTKDAWDVPVYFYEDGIYFDKESVDVRAGDTVFVSTYWTADYGDSYLSVAVDPARKLDDDKGDNRVGAWVTVR